MGIMDLKGCGCRARLPGLVFHCTRIFTRIVIKRCFALISTVASLILVDDNRLPFQISQATTKQKPGNTSEASCLGIPYLACTLARPSFECFAVDHYYSMSTKAKAKNKSKAGVVAQKVPEATLRYYKECLEVWLMGNRAKLSAERRVMND